MRNIFLQIFGIIKKLVILGVIVAGSMYLFRLASPGLYAIIKGRALSVLDSTTLYAYSKDTYLESIIHGHRNINLYTITKETPYYISMMPKDKLENTGPLGVLPPNVVVELRDVIRKGENVWSPAFFFLGEKPQHVYALFPREWEQNVKIFDNEKTIASFKAEYETFVKKNFQLMEVKVEDEKEYKEKYNDYYMIRGIKGDNHFYAPRTDRSKINKAYSYFLNQNNINMVMLQTDKEWARPALVLGTTEEDQ